MSGSNTSNPAPDTGGPVSFYPTLAKIRDAEQFLLINGCIAIHWTTLLMIGMFLALIAALRP